ncbi:DUF58 domain-containing protein [Methanocella sp. MCL-LM]|uniref:DUF58 domain-containing protein n=1 Tax=Methanocella sp. MCL-LM TaxID=3412035 RepID=UPI003C71F8BE
MQVKDYTVFIVGLTFLVLGLLTGGIIFYLGLILAILAVFVDGFLLMYRRFSISRSLIVRRGFSRRDLLLGTATQLVTSLEYAGRTKHRALVRQPVHPTMIVIKPIPEQIELSRDVPVYFNLELKPGQAGEVYLEPMSLVISSAFFRESIQLGSREKINVHVGVGSADVRSSASNSDKQYSDFLLSKLIETRGGTDFSTIRNYAAGDDIKNIDWARSARAGILVIREYEEDRPLPVFFLIDVDSSMGTGDVSSELYSAVNLTALLIKRLTTDSNMFGLACFSREGVVKYQWLGIGRDHLSKIREILTWLEPEKSSSLTIKNDLSLTDANIARSALRTSPGLEVLSTVMDETIKEHSANVKADGFMKAVSKVSRSIDTPCQIVVLTNLSMGLASLMNGIRMAKYYGHSVSVVLTPHIWYTDKEQIDAETCYEKYQQVKNTLARIRGSGSVKVIDLCLTDRPEDSIYRSSTYRQLTAGLRRW